ncbi:MAG: 4Fe-4S dicluster domain-containing protein [Alistipes sp.]|nr:4Fe-4S dicluster domain-containing protein [Alistipes sp.]
MLRKIRIAVAWVVFAAALLLVLDLTGALHGWLGWVARVQLVPAILAGNLIALVVVGVLTLLFGRVYCSVLCPLGIAQDGISWLSGRRKGKKARFSYTKPMSWLRYGLLTIFVVALVVGIGAVVSLLDPWGIFGRTASNLLAPLWGWGNNALAWVAERADSYAFHSREVWVRSWIVLSVTAATFALIAVLAWRRGRTWCTKVCPVGTLLGLLSLAAPFRIRFDKSACTHCGVCEKKCKSGCIDSKTQTIDRTRCVVCFDCLDSCNFGAIKYGACGSKRGGSAKEAPDGGAPERTSDKKGVSRRNFLAIAGAIAVANTVKAQQLKVDGGLAEIEDKKRPVRKNPITPPGSKDARNMKQHCVACQLCVTACPNGVLVSSSRLATLMQPEMTFERGYCRPECVECSEVCPAGAIERISPADKSAISVGNANYIADNCVVGRDNLPCTACERHCPTKAITLVPRDPADPKSLKIPAIDNTLCIGCGACEYHCPARPFAAIYVEGNVTHHSL